MMRFGLDEVEVRELIETLRGPTDEVAAFEAFARVAWNLIAEPGDQLAGAVTAALGVGRALELLIARADAGRFAAELSGTGADATVGALRGAIERWQPRLSAQSVVRAIEGAARIGVALLLPSDEDWPRGLADLGAGSPLALWLRGDRDRLAQVERSVAIVGARAATGYGEHVAIEFAAGLADRGVAVVSGGAYGIDGASHRAALAADGMTAAVLAGGLDRFYPAGHERLLHEIIERGVVLSEVPCGTPPTRFRFLLRNRLLAAMSRAVVVIEAGYRSGSLNTAGHAAQIGRPLGAVPGPITSPTSAGCHRLLRDYGAVCVTQVEEVLDLIGEAESAEAVLAEPFDRPDERSLRVIDALRPRRGREVEEIARLSGLSPAEVRACLGRLELAGRVARVELGWVYR